MPHLPLQGLLLLAALASTSLSGLAQGSLLAVQLNPANIAEIQPRGPDAIAGIGDWVLGNGTLCAAVSNVDHESGLTPWGGALVDLYHCERGDDQWTFQHVLPNLDKDNPLEPVAITAEVTGERAHVRVSNRGLGLQLESQYEVNTSSARELAITHRLTRVAPGKAVNMFGSMVLHPHQALAPWSMHSADPRANRGFHHLGIDRSDPSSQVAAMFPADTHILVGSDPLGEISYGLQLMSAHIVNSKGEKRPLPLFQQTDPTYSLQGVLSRPPWLGGKGKPGWLEFIQSRLMDIREGETLIFRQRILLGDRADVASITDQIYSGPIVRGKITNGAAAIHINDITGTPLTVIRADNAGLFSARLPESTSQIEITTHSLWGTTEPRQYDVAQTGSNIGVIEIPRAARLNLPRGNPMRLIFKGIPPTPDPDFGDDFMDLRVDGKRNKGGQSANYIDLAGITSDPDVAYLSPGRYRVLATRGMAYSVTETTLDVTSGDDVSLQLDPPRQLVDLRGWVTADFHVHSAPSFDSAMPVDARLRGFVAQGGQVLVATEHNSTVNYQRDVERLGLSEVIRVVSGMELTGIARTSSMPYTHGHINAFPLQADDTAFAGGLPRHEGHRLRSLYATLRARSSDVMIQMNHPRMNEPGQNGFDNAYFDHLIEGEPFDPSRPLSHNANASLIEPDSETGLRDLDFDLIEIANGNDFALYQTVRRDWFALLSQGERIFATANSDTHGTSELVAIPQNLVALEGPYREEEFLKAIRSGHLVGTTGPLLRVSAMGPGDTVAFPGDSVRAGKIRLHISVDAADWVPVSSVTVYLNGEVLHNRSIQRGQAIELPIEYAGDGYLVVEAHGEADDLYGIVAPGFTPFAFSNPIFIETPLK